MTIGVAAAVITAAGVGTALHVHGPSAAVASQHPVAPAPSAFVYDPPAYRHAVETQLGRPLSDANFTKVEGPDRDICGWTGDKFNDFVAIESDNNDLPRLGRLVQYVCPSRVGDVQTALQKMALD